MILAGDIGGTNTRLAFADVQSGRCEIQEESIFSSRDFRSLDEIVLKFMAGSSRKADAACFGIAGPVRNQRVETSNLPWVVLASHLRTELSMDSVFLINDLEANACGIAALDEKDLVPLNQIQDPAPGNQAVIAAGTGLGEAGLFWDGTRHRVFACEGGHTDFAPRTDLEVELLHFLRGRFGHVSYERIISGPGLVNVFHFLRDSYRGHHESWLAEEMRQGDPAAAISKAALAGKSPLAEQALDLMISVYGAEAGNLALKLFALGGVFLGGGISPKILPKLAGPLFMQAFLGKGRMQTLLESVPVKVITNDKTALLGAACYADAKIHPQ